MSHSGKITIIGGGGLRTPLLIYGLVQVQTTLGLREIALFDPDGDRLSLMRAVSQEILRRSESDISLTLRPRLEDAIEGADFILTSIRVGGIQARARDERLAIEHGLIGQETTPPVGLAMALRTIPVILSQAKLIERLNPSAWLINFTNPAGLITQALTTHTGVRVIGICDTPMELFLRIAKVLDVPPSEVVCDYFGLNHLGWVSDIRVKGESVMAHVLADDRRLQELYPSKLFWPEMIRALGLLPTEYLFFFYSQRVAYRHLLEVGATRGEEVERLNAELVARLREAIGGGERQSLVDIYGRYLDRRSRSYMRLEGDAQSAFTLREGQGEDPFDAATGYHRMAIDVMTALVSSYPKRVVVDVVNRGAIADLEATDVVEVPCLVDNNGPRPLAVGRLPDTVRGLVQSVKAYERLAIRACVERSDRLARLALTVHPLVGQWELATQIIDRMIQSDSRHLGYLR